MQKNRVFRGKIMLYNKNIVLEIILSCFSDVLEKAIYEEVVNLDSYELENIFQQIIDFAEVGDIGDAEIEYYRVDTDEKMNKVYGIIKVDVSLDGYVHWDGENELLDTENHEFEFDFKFNDREEQYSDFEISP